MTDDGYGWNEYLTFERRNPTQDVPIYLSKPFIKVMNILYSFFTKHLEGKIDIGMQENLLTQDFIRTKGVKQFLDRVNRRFDFVEEYVEHHTGVRISIYDDLALEVLCLSYRRCFVNKGFSNAVRQIYLSTYEYNIFREEEIQELYDNEELRINAGELNGTMGGDMDLRAFEHIPLYLLLKFSSRPATTPIEIFYEENFRHPNPYWRGDGSSTRRASVNRTYRIGGGRRFNRRSQLNQIDFDGDYWGMSPDMFSERQPVDYYTSWGGSSMYGDSMGWSRKEPVRNLIHESIQLKIGQSGEKRFPMNYFRRGINLES